MMNIAFCNSCDVDKMWSYSHIKKDVVDICVAIVSSFRNNHDIFGGIAPSPISDNLVEALSLDLG